ncbi:YlmH family RNA-binding protein [Anaeromicropila populeti]|uniref:RNA-binding protein YlmH, contains S4-like domain n=1 Tax=Anaeromicropila populeti TaxID=37658 RepID=A0A1I6L880_9FIRM|nr:YlmH/Sll1252 family protein [Anaeromicropila populeti]SFR99713.1 RNA-binding protein YlmH, contains S4-like domain [Anaeromicropila populeti]
MTTDKDEKLLCNRLIELSNLSFRRNTITYSWFLNLNEQNIFYRTSRDLAPVSYQLYGGYESAERKIVIFYADEWDYSSYNSFTGILAVIKIEAVNEKFADQLTHRDYLGAILNLGIERIKIGDIIVKNSVAYVFCHSGIKEFILDYLTKVKHTNVKCTMVESELEDFTPSYKTIKGTVSSIRLDAVLGVAFQTSRSSLSGLISGGKVFVNGKLMESNSYPIKEQDIVSVRGHGKFIFREVMHQTKKGRYSITIDKYI